METLSKLGPLNLYPSFQILMGNTSLDHLAELLKGHYELYLSKNMSDLDSKVYCAKTKLPKTTPSYYELGRVVSHSRISDFKIHQPDGIYTVTAMSAEDTVSLNDVLQRTLGFYSYLRSVGSFK